MAPNRYQESKGMNNMKNEIIMSCPFCGSTDVSVCRTNVNACWIECEACGAGSESHKTRKVAIENWNRRFEACEATIVEDGDGDKEYWESQKRIAAMSPQKR